MRSLLTFVLIACAALALGGCALMSEEDRDFYGKGWINPRELDRPMQHHAIPNPESGSNPAVANQTNPIDPANTNEAWSDPTRAPRSTGW